MRGTNLHRRHEVAANISRAGLCSTANGVLKSWLLELEAVGVEAELSRRASIHVPR